MVQEMLREVVIGVDAGGTSTRCAAVTLDGGVVTRGHGGGANRFSSADPAAALRTALRDALEQVPDATVTGGVFGVAGASSSGHAEETVQRVWAELGLAGRPSVIDDICVAFAAGCTASAGSVLLAGTGAVAAYVCDGTVERRCDGYGWLLGDEGSAVWLGVMGLRAALKAIDGRGPATLLRGRLADALGIEAGEPQQIVRAAHAGPPAELGRLAPVVTRAATDGDDASAGIVAAAVARLLDSFAAIAPYEREPGVPPGSEPPGEPVVLAGSVLAGGPVADGVRMGIRDRFGGVVHYAADGALGAAGLALRGAGGPESAHKALLRRGSG